MDQHLNNRHSEILWKLLANPADNGHSYTGNLQSLVNDFPQSGLLQAMLVRAEGGKNVNHAAAYFNPRALYLLVNSSDSLLTVSAEQILGDVIDHRVVVENELPVAEEVNNTPVTVVAEDERSEVESIDQIVETEEDLAEPEQASEGVTESPVEAIEQENEVEEHFHPDQITDQEEEVSEMVFDETEPLMGTHNREDSEDVEPIVINSENESFYEDELVTEAGGVDEQQPGEEVPVMAVDEISREDEPINEIDTEHEEPQTDIEDDIYEEIVGIDDLSFEHVTRTFHEPVTQDEEHTEDIISEENGNKERALNLDDAAEKLIVGNIAATDYFVFDRAISERKQPDTPEIEPAIDPEIIAAEHKGVSKYHDDKMPYTFMWWLDKTRKEHAGIYQPFKLDTSQIISQSGAQELQQQYYENIFHLNSVEELDRSTSSQTIEFEMKTKEDRIIKRFIVEEPHISTPSSDKLDNENKAKKSAEDQDELVTETLARIYSDQMLYHKAINTYKKLMLKFPEKSRYFVDQIEQLERKIN